MATITFDTLKLARKFGQGLTHVKFVGHACELQAFFGALTAFPRSGHRGVLDRAVASTSSPAAAKGADIGAALDSLA